MRGKVIIKICIHLLSTHYVLSDEKVQRSLSLCPPGGHH